jgi:hypothetical protein
MNTKNSKINCNWILKAPYKIKLAFLQGISDGDGSASLSDWRVQIRTKFNASFLKELLFSLGIESRVTEGKAVISKFDEVIKCSKLPFFRHAESRSLNLKIIRRLLGFRNKESDLNDMKLLNYIFSLYAKGCGKVKINLMIANKFGVSFEPSHLRNILARGIDFYKIDNLKVLQYFDVLNNSVKSKKLSDSLSYNTCYEWVHRGVIPIDVKRKLSLGFKPSKEISSKFPHLNKFMFP